MRVFVSVPPPPEVQRVVLAAAQEAAQEISGIKWTKKENIHLTLKFLGEVPDEALTSICNALRVACSAHAPFEARLGGLGAFPSPRRARVIWTGVKEGSGEMSALASSVESTLEPLGFRREGRAYVPHATLGRTRGRPVNIDLHETNAPKIPVFRVTGAELTKSTLNPGGSIYETLETFSLDGVAKTTRGRDR